jgi:hypothetical protein
MLPPRFLRFFAKFVGGFLGVYILGPPPPPPPEWCAKVGVHFLASVVRSLMSLFRPPLDGHHHLRADASHGSADDGGRERQDPVASPRVLRGGRAGACVRAGAGRGLSTLRFYFFLSLIFFFFFSLSLSL